jgi:hypothetical protein
MLKRPFFANLAQALERRAERAERRERDAYLAKAHDHADLDLRLRTVDGARTWIPAYC